MLQETRLRLALSQPGRPEPHFLLFPSFLTTAPVSRAAVSKKADPSNNTK